jgi:hypothetical protein
MSEEKTWSTCDSAECSARNQKLDESAAVSAPYRAIADYLLTR